MILLGAGASVKAGVATAVAMTSRVLGHLDETSRDLAEFLIRELVAHSVRVGRIDLGSKASIDIEALATVIEDLSSRHRLELAAFVSAWHPRLAELDRGDHSPMAVRRLAKSVANVREPDGTLRAGWTESFERRFLAAITPSRRRPDLQSLREELIRAVQKEARRGSSKRLDYLKHLFTPLRSRGGAQDRLVIATLNYDNTVELAADGAGVKYDLGLKSWNEWRRFETDRPLLLLKLHGSIDWEWPANQDRIDRAETGDLPARPVLLFGGRNKLTAKGPFLDLLLAFADCLEEADRLTVIGYSFRDAHVNEVIAKWCRRGIDRVLRVVDLDEGVIEHASLIRRRKDPQSRAVQLPMRPPFRGFECIKKRADIALPSLFNDKNS